MRTFITLISTTFAIIVTLLIVPGVFVSGPGIFIKNFEFSAQIQQLLSLGMYAFVLALVNIFIRPIIKIISLPITILSFGIFTLLINISMFYLASYFTNILFQINIYFVSPIFAFICTIVISIVSAFFNLFIRK